MTSVILFIFGLIVGSFLNVWGLRYNSGLSLSGRSFCQRCGHQLRWFELVPVFSFLFQRGRCRSCHTRISWQYPLVELWTALIFITVPYVYLPVFCLFVVITIYDYRHKIIPDLLVYSALFLAIAIRLMEGGQPIDWLAGPILFGFLGLIWLVTRGRALGFGDAKLALVIGILLGGGVGFSAVMVAFWIGAVFGLLFLLISKLFPLLRGHKKITMKSEVPFAPFLVLGAWISLIFQLDLLHVSFL